MLIGPPLAAPLLIAFGAGTALLVNAASFGASLLTVRAIRARAPRRGAVAPGQAADILRDLTVGWAFFRRSRVLVTVAVSAVIVMLGAGSLNALDVFFVSENLGAPAEFYGFLGAAQGAGMVVGAAGTVVLAQRIGLVRMLWGSLMALGALTLIYARLTSFVPAVAVIFALGLVIPAINVAIGPIILQVTPRELVGRVSATLNPLINAGAILGVLLGGFLYGTALRGFHAEALGLRFGPLDTIFTGAGVLCLLGGVYAMVNLTGEVLGAGSQPPQRESRPATE
jgi:Na+/melibiose symporter-like transporter